MVKLSLFSFYTFKELKKSSLFLCMVSTHVVYLYHSQITNLTERFIAGAAARPGKIVGSVLRYNNCNAAAGVNAEAVEQRRMMRNLAGPVQYSSSANCSYPRRNSSSVCKNERGEEEALEGVPSGMQRNAQHIQRKVAAAQGGSGSHWY